LFVLSTGRPSRKAARDYLKQGGSNDIFEEDILAAYEKGELKSVSPSKAASSGV